MDFPWTNNTWSGPDSLLPQHPVPTTLHTGLLCMHACLIDFYFFLPAPPHLHFLIVINHDFSNQVNCHLPASITIVLIFFIQITLVF